MTACLPYWTAHDAIAISALRGFVHKPSGWNIQALHLHLQLQQMQLAPDTLTFGNM